MQWSCIKNAWALAEWPGEDVQIYCCASTRCFLIPTQRVLRKCVCVKFYEYLKIMNVKQSWRTAGWGSAGRTLGERNEGGAREVTGRSHDFLPVQFNCWKFQQQCEIVFYIFYMKSTRPKRPCLRPLCEALLRFCGSDVFSPWIFMRFF